MTKKREPRIAPATSQPQNKRPNTLHFTLPADQIAKLDALAAENNVTRSAVIAIACSRILKSGL